MSVVILQVEYKEIHLLSKNENDREFFFHCLFSLSILSISSYRMNALKDENDKRRFIYCVMSYFLFYCASV